MRMKRFSGKEKTNSIPTTMAITGPSMLSSSCQILALRLAVVDVADTVAAVVK